MLSKQTFVYKTVGDCSIQADIYRPPDALRHPAILWLHGGALIMGSRETIAPDQVAAYVEAGFAVIAVDYRLAPETKLDAIIDDLRDAHRWVRASGPDLFQIDPERLAVIGHSAGGYLTLMTGFCVEPRPRALVAFYGYGDIVGGWYTQPDPFYNGFPAVPEGEVRELVGESPTTGTIFEGSLHEKRSRFYLYCRQRGLWPQEVGGHDPGQEPDWFVPYCPIRQVTADYPPTLLLHGDQDTDVPFEQSALMSEELGRHGVEHELMMLVNRGHGFDHAGLNDPTIARLFHRIIAFLQKHTTD